MQNRYDAQRLLNRMHYWNSANFAGLVDAASHFDRIPGCEGLGEYCRLRERGLRKAAFGALREWLDSTADWSIERRREVCLIVLETHARLPKLHTLLSHPLSERFVMPVLEDWHRETGELAPTRWLGLLDYRIDLLQDVLRRAPKDLPVRRKLINMALGQVEHQTHHLRESLFLGELADANDALVQANRLIHDAPEPDGLEDLVQEAEHHGRVLADWEEYERAPKDDFPTWCSSRGRNYRWPRIYYYTPRGAS